MALLEELLAKFEEAKSGLDFMSMIEGELGPASKEEMAVDLLKAFIPHAEQYVSSESLPTIADAAGEAVERISQRFSSCNRCHHSPSEEPQTQPDESPENDLRCVYLVFH